MSPVERSGGRRPVRAVLRFTAAVMTVSGLLLLLDAGLTLVWQEPISAALAARSQSALEGDLEGWPSGSGEELGDRELRRLARKHARAVETGEAWGQIELPEPEREYVVVEGTEEEPLRLGPGHYPETALPGQGRTVAIAGHRTTYMAPFRTIDQLAEGDEIVVEMPWARFTYLVTDQDIVPPTQTSVIRDVGRERLVLSACHPLYSAAERIILFADLDRVEPA